MLLKRKNGDILDLRIVFKMKIVKRNGWMRLVAGLVSGEMINKTKLWPV
jgi:hypothetical protein